MDKISEKNSYSTTSTILTISLITFVIALILAPILATSKAHASEDSSQQNLPTMELRVDAQNRARAFCNGLKTAVDIGGFLEFYEKDLLGNRTRIAKGPWNGNLKDNLNGTYTLTGSDAASGASFVIEFRQADPRTVEIDMAYKAPLRPSSLGFDIVKLSGDLFKGSILEASPVAITDAVNIPIEPLPLAQRMLLTKKNRVLLKSALCDVEILDLTESGTMLAADSRNIPWDNEKSIFFGGEKDNLLPGETYTFRYSIRCLPPTNTAPLQVPLFSAIPQNETNGWSFYALQPKEEHKEAGQYQVQLQDTIYGTPSGIAETTLTQELKKRTALHLPITEIGQGGVSRGIFIERIPQGDSSGLPAEGFEIITTPEKVTIRGGSERGCLYGVYALMGRLTNNANSWQLECGTIRDWPALSFRGVCIEMLNPSVRDVALMKRYLDAFSRARSNVVIFLHTPQQMRSWSKMIDDGGWTKDQMVEITQYVRSLQMDVWGGMGSAFKIDDFKEMNVSVGTNLYDPFLESSYANLFSLYEELLQTYNPSTLLISHDEIQGLSVYAAKSGKSTAEILSDDVRIIHNWLTQRNVKTAMWGDMLLDFNTWENVVGSANSQNPYFNSGATHLALKLLPSDILILDWHYNDKNDFGSIDYFHQNGFNVIGAPWYNSQAARTLAQSALKYGGGGVITTDWGFWRTLSPAATTLYGPLCAWSTTCSINDENSQGVALADTVRDWGRNDWATGFSQDPVGLETVSNATTTNLFGFGPVLDLQALLAGKQIFSSITFDILSDNGGAAKNCVLVANGDGSFPNQSVVFQGSMLAQAVAFLHTSLVEEPQFRPRKLGFYLIEYENGQKETVNLLENWNITDIRSSEGLRHNDWTFTRNPDVLIGAGTGGRGFSAGGIPLNLQVFIWKNPYPAQKIRNITLNGALTPLNSKIALVGLTSLQLKPIIISVESKK